MTTPRTQVTAKQHLAGGGGCSFMWRIFCFVVVIAGNFLGKFFQEVSLALFWVDCLYLYRKVVHYFCVVIYKLQNFNGIFVLKR